MMNGVNNNTSTLVDVTSTLIKRNTAMEIAKAKQSGEPVDVEKIQQSNQEIKDQSKNVAVAAYHVNLTKNAIDTYVQASQNSSSANEGDSENDIYTFDAQEVNEVRAAAQRRAVGIDVYERIKEDT